MKKQYIFLCLLFTSTFLSAQETTSDTQLNHKYFVGGSIFFNTNNGGTSNVLTALPSAPFTTSISGARTTSFSFSPYMAGKQGENWSFGIGASFNYSKIDGLGFFINNEFYESEQVNSGFSFYTFGRFTSTNEHKLKLYVQPAIGVGLQSRSINYDTEVLSDPNDNHFAQVFMTTGFGIQYQVSDRFRLLANLGDFTGLIGRETIEDTDFEENYNSVGLNFGMQSMRLSGELLF